MTGNLLRVFAVFLLIGAIIAGWYGFRLSEQATPAPVTEQVAPLKLQPQVVAKQFIPSGHVLTGDDLTIAQVEQPNALGFASRSEVIGRMVTDPIEAGMPILATDFPVLGPAAELLKSGERGVAIKVDEVVGVSGFVKPGDHVDVLLYLRAENEAVQDTSAQVVLRDVRVIGFGQEIQEEKQSTAASTDGTAAASDAASAARSNDNTGASSRSAVLAVNEKDMTKLMLAANSGLLRLALRGAEPPEELPIAGTASIEKNATSMIKLSELAGSGNKPATASAPKKTAVRSAVKVAEPVSTVILYNGDKSQTLHFKGN